MRNLIEFLQRHLYWLVFLVLEVVSLISLFKYNNYQGSVYFTTANRVTGSIYSCASHVVSYLHLGTENRYLESENERLRREVLALRKHLRRTDSVSAQAMEHVAALYDVVPAQVVSSTLHRSNNLITIDKGTKDGIRPEMGVVCSRGVVGIVYLTSHNYSVVIPLLNISSQISCRLKHSDFFGTMQWRRGDPTLSYVTGIPKYAKAKRGDVIETNGYSDIFPEGLPVGKVLKVGNAPDGLTYELTVRLSTDFMTLRNVSVITNYTKPERKLLEQQADSLMTAAGGDDS